MIIKTEEKKAILLEAGRRLREVLDLIGENMKIGTVPTDLDKLANEKIKEFGDKPAFLNYSPEGSHPFPASICVSVNNDLVHGIPTDIPFKDGDVVAIDCGLEHNGVFVDAAFTKIIGNGTADTIKLLEATNNALKYSIVACQSGNTVGDIGSAIEQVAVENSLCVPPELGGHGVGGAVHEEPFIANLGDAGEGDKLEVGQVLAIEPIFTLGTNPNIKVGEDGYSYTTIDNSIGAHFEHTILITESAPIVVTGKMW